MVRRRLILATLAGAALVAPAAAGATTTSSTNWAGYAITRSGVSFSRVAGAWTVPTLSCAGDRTYSAHWVGLGGESSSSAALEQIGTEADCAANGAASYSAWYELVPSAAADVKMTVRAGDRMTASVVVAGHRVRLRLADRTRGSVFVKTLQPATVDVASAEWIVEAPALCDASTFDEPTCQVTPLADVGTTGFSGATATTTGGHTGTISDSAWTATAIALVPERQGFGPRRGRPSSGGAAVTGPLTAAGSTFAVTLSAA